MALLQLAWQHGLHEAALGVQGEGAPRAAGIGEQLECRSQLAAHTQLSNSATAAYRAEMEGEGAVKQGQTGGKRGVRKGADAGCKLQVAGL